MSALPPFSSLTKPVRLTLHERHATMARVWSSQTGLLAAFPLDLGPELVDILVDHLELDDRRRVDWPAIGFTALSAHVCDPFFTSAGPRNRVGLYVW